MLNFIVPGTPVAKGRARVSSRGGFIRHYTPEKTVSYENTVRGYAVEAMRKANTAIIDAPCQLELILYMPIPSAWSKSKKEKAEKGEIRPGVKPDCSNIAKAIEDAMNGIVFTDDKFICDLHVQKFYSALPRAEILVFTIDCAKNYQDASAEKYAYDRSQYIDFTRRALNNDKNSRKNI